MLTLKSIAEILAPFIKIIVLKMFKGYEISSDVETSKTNIVWLVKTLGPGGAERQVVNFANKLALCDNFNITIICFSCLEAPDNFYFNHFDESIKIIDLNSFKLNQQIKVPKILYAMWSLDTVKKFKKVVYLLTELKPHLVQGWLDEPSIVCSLAGLHTKIAKICISTRNTNPSNFLANRIYFKGVYSALAKYRNILFLNNSLFGSRDYEKWLKLEYGTIKTINNGFDIDLFDSFDKLTYFTNTQLPKIVGTVCRLDLEKDLDLWFEIVKKLTIHSQINFKLIGDGPLRAKLSKQIRSNNLENRVEMVHSIADIYSEMIKFDIFLLTSKFEGLPNVLIEAQLLGLPVIATNAGGSSETFVNGNSGILLDNRDYNSICQEIESLLRDEPRYNSFVKNAKIQSRISFDINKKVSDLIELYNGL